MKLALAALLLILGSAHAQSAPKSIEHDLDSKYRDRIFVLRGFYRTESIHFDANGKLVSKADTGYGPTDGSVHAATFRLVNHQLKIQGDLPVLIYDSASGKAAYHQGYVKREIVIDLSDPLDYTAIETALWSVFYRPEERPLPPCSADRAEGFRRTALEHALSKPAGSGPDTHSNAIACFPNGETAPRIRHAADGPHVIMTPPSATYDPEPEFPEPARQKKLSGKVVLAMIIDSFGRPSTIVVVRPLGNGFDESAAKTVHSWRFEPAKADGQPAPIAITVEVTFHGS